MQIVLVVVLLSLQTWATPVVNPLCNSMCVDYNVFAACLHSGNIHTLGVNQTCQATLVCCPSGNDIYCVRVGECANIPFPPPSPQPPSPQPPSPSCANTETQYTVAADQLVYGMSLGDLNEDWWKRFLNVDLPNSPIVDTTGAMCHNGQGGPFFYLHGTYGGNATRTCNNVCSSKYIVVPLINAICDTTPRVNTTSKIIYSPTPDQLAPNCQALLAPFNASVLSLVVNNTQIQNLACFRAAKYDPFEWLLTIWNNRAAQVDKPVTVGRYLGVVDGYYVVLKPLPIGTTHVIFAAKGFATWEYFLNVVNC